MKRSCIDYLAACHFLVVSKTAPRCHRNLNEMTRVLVSRVAMANCASRMRWQARTGARIQAPAPGPLLLRGPHLPHHGVEAAGRDGHQHRGHHAARAVGQRCGPPLRCGIAAEVPREQVPEEAAWQGCTRWQQVRGGITAAAMSMRRIGWEWTSAFSIRMDKDIEVKLTECPRA